MPVLALFACKSGSPIKKQLGPLVLGKADNLRLGVNYFMLERLIVYRDPAGLAAMSLVCTHQECMLRIQGQQFQCPCHGSVFDQNGVVLQGPAKIDLPWYKLSLNAQSELIVLRDQLVDKNWRLKI